jgi:hypothetical protein
MGIEPTHKVPQTFALPLGYIQHMLFTFFACSLAVNTLNL